MPASRQTAGVLIVQSHCDEDIEARKPYANALSINRGRLCQDFKYRDLFLNMFYLFSSFEEESGKVVNSLNH